MIALAILQWAWFLAVPAYLVSRRTWLLWLAVVAFGADEVVQWYAWLIVGVLHGVMTHEAGPGRAW